MAVQILGATYLLGGRRAFTTEQKGCSRVLWNTGIAKRVLVMIQRHDEIALWTRSIADPWSSSQVDHVHSHGGDCVYLGEAGEGEGVVSGAGG